ncbi:MAG: NAD(P)H-dependent oxidoreductase [Casimicrobiaceae bacterium]|nr:NAD(P)H-dependent oxidoreductase [Casimicrobiaceae bacterium]MCX8098037.1 NAD(P)H-dependent oxidoreductase [Casimicrobiaceae bacterium]MDW8312435.1 NAD(P)H-dependent oxidoreductase [Burkholderiales bacterium]
MQVLLISGSGRPGGQSLRIARMLEGELVRRGVETALFDVHAERLGLWESEATPEEATHLARLRSEAERADALVVVSPEWAGMVPPALKNALIHLTGGQIAHKPVLLVGVSAGRSGTYPIAELRSFAFKNSHALVIPHHVILRGVEALFANGWESTDEASVELGKRLDAAIAELLIYAEALGPVRARLVELRSRFKNGM